MSARAALVGIGLVSAMACGLAPDVGPRLAGTCSNADSRPETPVSFRRDIVPLIVMQPGGCSCHLPSGGSPGTGIQLSGLNLSSFEELREGGVTSGDEIVVAGQPCASVLFQKLSEAPPFGSRMPLNGPPFFTADQLRLVHDWIAEGGEDN